MNKDHLSGVLKVEKASFRIPWSYDSFLYELTKNELACYFVALNDDDTVTGYAGMHLVVDEGQITNIAVLPEFRGQEIGKSLLSALIREAREKKMAKMFLEVASKNQAALAMYKSAGFFEVGKRNNYYKNPLDDALILEYTIT